MALLLPTCCQVLFAPHRLFFATVHLERGIYSTGWLPIPLEPTSSMGKSLIGGAELFNP
jgi:hypothetical protein